MFDAFEVQTEDASALGKRLVVSFGLAAVTLVGLGIGVAAIASRPSTVTKEKQVDVSFRPPPPPPEPVKVEPPPPPKPKAKPPPPVVVAEVPPPAPAAMVAPKEVPKEKPKESDTAVQAIAVAVGGTGNGKMDEAPVAPRDEDESEAPVIASAGKPNGPVNLPEDADPPVPNEDNAQPEYPESARTTGQEAKVVLKIVVEADGRVGRIQVLKGEEPFVSSALAVVRTWTYEPATLDGAPITVFKIVNITFSLRE